MAEKKERYLRVVRFQQLIQRPAADHSVPLVAIQVRFVPSLHDSMYGTDGHLSEWSHNSASRGSLSERRVTRRVRTAFFIFRLRIFGIGAPAPVRRLPRATRVCVCHVKKESGSVTRPGGEFSVEFSRRILTALL